jgi:hypothetical protein
MGESSRVDKIVASIAASRPSEGGKKFPDVSEKIAHLEISRLLRSLSLLLTTKLKRL